LRFLDRLGHRLFEPEVLPRLQRGHAELEVRADRRGDRDRVNRGIFEQVLKTRCDAGGRVTSFDDVEFLSVEVGHSGHRDPV
jgi:hypothetical protein